MNAVAIDFEKALRDSEALYHSLVASLPQYILRKDLDGRFTFVNQRFAASFGRTPQELIGKTDFDLYPSSLAAKYVHDDQEIIHRGAVFETVEDNRLPDGTQIVVQTVKTPVRDAQGKIVGVQVLFWDITAQHRAALAVADSERRYRRLTEATLDGIVLIDQNELITLFNPAAERMFGYRATEILGLQARMLVPAKHRKAHQRGFRRLIDTNQGLAGRTLELVGLRKDGSEFPVEAAFSVLSRGVRGGARNSEQEPVEVLAALRDLTERNKIRAFLVQNEKLASIGMLSAGVAHEINNPLSFIANNLAVLERDCQTLLTLVEQYEAMRPQLAPLVPAAFTAIDALCDSADVPYIRANLLRIIQRTRDGVDRVTRIVQGLRGLARTDTPRRQETLLADLVAGSLEIVRGRLRKSRIVVEQEHDHVQRVSCVAPQINQVILNLLLNAVQAIEAYRPHGGRIVIRTRRLPDEMLLEVADNGCGIAPENKARLFNPFFTTKEAGEGTGLGLSITHNIVTAHGGRIEVDSQLGDGAAFRIFLPLRGAGRNI